MAAFKECSKNMELDLINGKCNRTANAETVAINLATNAKIILVWNNKKIHL